MRETWYVLEDGTAVHPSEVAADKNGALAHKKGLVAMRGDTPRSRGVDIDESGKQLFAGKGDHDGDDRSGGTKKPDAPATTPAPPATTAAPAKDREMKPAKPKPAQPQKPYKTR